MGFGRRDPEANYDQMKARLRQEMEKVFRPEFLNRLDDVVVFRPLEKEDIMSIVDMELNKFSKIADTSGGADELDALQQAMHGADPAAMVAAIGPCIGAAVYEVGPDVARDFAAAGLGEALLVEFDAFGAAGQGVGGVGH
jgi:hypothetical protein